MLVPSYCYSVLPLLICFSSVQAFEVLQQSYKKTIPFSSLFLVDLLIRSKNITLKVFKLVQLLYNSYAAILLSINIVNNIYQLVFQICYIFINYIKQLKANLAVYVLIYLELLLQLLFFAKAGQNVAFFFNLIITAYFIILRFNLLQIIKYYLIYIKLNLIFA